MGYGWTSGAGGYCDGADFRFLYYDNMMASNYNFIYNLYN